MTIPAATKLEAHPPLARDTAGNLLRIPPDTSSFGLGRETTGRPRLLRGPDKQLMRFPLHTCPEDIIDLCGPGIYRVYALDALGEQLADEHIARWDLTPARERNTSTDPMLALRADRPAVMATMANPSTDMRFALETMAQMMRTNSDALRLVAESQVDLAKAIATAKGLPRNASMYLPPAPRAANDDREDDDDDDDGEEEAAPKNIYDVLAPIAEQLAPVVGTLATTFASGAASRPSAKPQSTASSPTDELASRPFEARELIDFGYAHRKSEAKRFAKQSAPTVQLHARVLKDPQLLQQIMAIKSALASDEIETLMTAAATWPEEEQTQFLNSIKPVSTEVAVEFCREVLTTIRAQRAGSDDKGAV